MYIYATDCWAQIKHFLYHVSFKEGILVTVFSNCIFGSLPSDVELLNHIAPVMPLILEVDMLLGHIGYHVLFNSTWNFMNVESSTIFNSSLLFQLIMILLLFFPSKAFFMENNFFCI